MRAVCKCAKTVIFALILIFGFDVSTKVLIDKGAMDRINQYQMRIKEFYDEVPGTLDAVYLGASHVYTYWLAPIAWNQKGISVFPFSSGSQPAAAIPFLIEEAQKTQPQALIIANLNQLVVGSADEASVHWLADGIPLSKNKANMVYTLYGMGEGADAPDPLEYLFPIIRFHSRWDELSARDVHYKKTDGMKGACYFSDFFTQKIDVSENYQKVDLYKKQPLLSYEQSVLENILNYCDEHKTNILFVIVPQFTGAEYRTAQYNSAQDYIESRGYSVLNLTQKTEEIGIDITSDYCTSDGKHLNVYGAIKFTNYLSEYLVNRYGFENKRAGGGNPLYASWDEAGVLYQKRIEPYLTEEDDE